MILFIKFWLENDLIEVEAEVARERLNNRFLDSQFVCKLQITCSMTAADLQKRIKSLSEHVESLYNQSGWTVEELFHGIPVNENLIEMNLSEHSSSYSP
jgi:hypothetical protein